MNTRLTAGLAALFTAAALACGSPTGPDDQVHREPPAFTDLIASVPDSTVFVGDTVSVDLLAVTDDGDTVTAPDSATLDAPNGFTVLSDRRVAALDEAAGQIIGRLNPTDSTQVRAALQLSDWSDWAASWRCYGMDEAVRDGETVRIDSIHGRAEAAVYEYTDSTEMEGRFRGRIHVVRFWADGLIDTTSRSDGVFLDGVKQARVDTLVVQDLQDRFVPATDSSTSDSPSYRDAPPGLCGAEWDRGGPFHVGST